MESAQRPDGSPQGAGGVFSEQERADCFETFGDLNQPAPSVVKTGVFALGKGFSSHSMVSNHSRLSRISGYSTYVEDLDL